MQKALKTKGTTKDDLLKAASGGSSASEWAIGIGTTGGEAAAGN